MDALCGYSSTSSSEESHAQEINEATNRKEVLEQPPAKKRKILKPDALLKMNSKMHEIESAKHVFLIYKM